MSSDERDVLRMAVVIGFTPMALHNVRPIGPSLDADADVQHARHTTQLADTQNDRTRQYGCSTPICTL